MSDSTAPWAAPGVPLPPQPDPIFPVFSSASAAPRPGPPIVGHPEQFASLTGWATPGSAAPGPTAPVPAGPGVRAPFPVAPSEGRGKRLGWAWAIAALIVVLCCGGGLAAGTGLIVTGVQALNEQADSVMNEYLSAIRDEDYQTAYDLLCDRIQRQETLESFTDSAQSGPRLRSFEIGELEITDGLRVPVTETYADNSSSELTYTLFQDTDTGKLEVCGSR